MQKDEARDGDPEDTGSPDTGTGPEHPEHGAEPDGGAVPENNAGTEGSAGTDGSAEPDDRAAAEPDDRAAAEPDDRAAAEPDTGRAQEEDPWAALKDILPWEGKAKRADKVLLGFLIGIPVFYLIMWPLRPMLIAKMPVVLSLVTGAKTVIAGAGAFADVERFPLWLVILAGLAGTLKFDWLWWYAGRRWADRVVNFFAQDEKSRKRIAKLRTLPHWLLLTLVFFARWPGVPGSLVWITTGWSRISFKLFFTANLLGNLVLVTICAVIGYEIGQPAVDFLKLVDKYAIWISVALIVIVAVWSGRGQYRKAAK